MRRNFSSFAIVGGGPSGFYTAKKLFQINKNFKIDIFEKLPVPFGLIRYGVAPDHQKVKNCQNELSAISSYPNFNFYGNVEIGKDITIKQLEDNYSGVIFAYGAQTDLQLNIKNEYQFKNIYASNSIVNWYNTHPEYIDFKFNVDQVKNVVIVGNGNVTLDIMRVLCMDKEQLKQTDIYDKAYEVIKENQIENITIVGRRGVVQSAFTLKELRELSKMDKFEFYLLKQDLQNSLNQNSVIEITDMGVTFGQLIEKWGVNKEIIQNIEQSLYFQQSLKTRANLRKIEFMNKTFKILQTQKDLEQVMTTKSNKVKVFFRYLLDCDELIGENDQLKSIKFAKTKLQGQPFEQKTLKSNEFEQIDCDILIKSIGFKSESINGLELKNNIVNNSHGCMIDPKNDQIVEIGKYVVGWLKTGPKGIIDQTFIGSEETVNNIRRHYESKLLSDKECQIQDILSKIKYFNFNDWKKIDQYEKEQGQQQQKIRVKASSFDQMDKIRQ